MQGSGPDLVLANARLVLAGEVVTGSVAVRGGVIAAVDTGARVPAGALDCEGATVLPGLIELHTDNLERHLKPRPTVEWPHGAAVVAHDGEMASAGITTVFDAVRVGALRDRSTSSESFGYARPVATEIRRLAAAGLLRIDHRLHLRTEVCSQTVLGDMDQFSAGDRIGIISIMDHTPGQRQFTDMPKYRRLYMGRYQLDDRQMDEFIVFAKGLSARFGDENLRGIVERAGRLGAVLASHDDTTVEHVALSAARGIGFAEFPTTLAAARACHGAGIPVMMGAPNILQGGSHSGNVAAMELAEQGLLDILSSDYAPSALLMGAMKLGRETGDLPGAVAMVTGNPARAVGLADRGEIAVGKRADLLSLREIDGLSVVTGVWSAGRKVG
ncbi:MAG: alpha-D-ribose 1-methylphosphonate 5-triphosphate diphosphatase [Limibaculum sp.]